jgi:hypothetical protein
MLALSTATEITGVIVLFFLLMGLLTLLRLILRKEEPLWRAIRIGFFVERVSHESEPVEDPRPPTTYQGPG